MTETYGGIPIIVDPNAPRGMMVAIQHECAHVDRYDSARCAVVCEKCGREITDLEAYYKRVRV